MGVLGATAMPLYNTWQQRAYGSEAIVMMKQLTEGEILYFLEHNDFFPGQLQSVQVDQYGAEIPGGSIQEIRLNLNLTIKSNGRLNYLISNNGPDPATGKLSCTIQITADFNLFRNNNNYLIAIINEDGNVTITDWDSFSYG
jgi:hypothetical protein